MKKLLAILLIWQVRVIAQEPVSNVYFRELPGRGFQLISSSGQPANNIIWDEAGAFVNGYAIVLDKQGFSFVNTQGKVITSERFEAVRNFSNGLAAVQKKSKWGFVDGRGVFVVHPVYDIVYDFTETVTLVMAVNKWSMIDREGKVLYRPDIDLAFGFRNGVSKVRKDNRVGNISINGAIEWTDFVPASTQRNATQLSSNAAGSCPDNIDFERGDFRNWTCYTGSVDSAGNTNVITVAPSGPVNNRHTIVPRVTPSAIDPFGLFPTNPPDGSNFAVRLGNTRIGAQAERIRYRINVPTNDSNFAIIYDYAVVFQDPGHTNWTQPRFQARLFDSAANSYIDCASFEYISTTNLPGFAVSPVDTTVIYKPWSSVFVSLRDYPGRTLFLEFTNADCVRRGHWGYAYADVKNVCGTNIALNYQCGNPAIATLTAPPGFQTIHWWNGNFSSMYGSGQTITLNPAPPINSTVWMELIPYNDFGCRDTIPVRMTGSFTPVIRASAQQAICAPHTVSFVNQDAPSLSATWDFGDGTSATGDSVSHTYLSPGTYIVTLQVTLPGGCSGIATDTIQILHPAASISYTGGTHCGNASVQFQASTSLVDTLIWHFGDGQSVSGNLSQVSHQYAPGVYLPSITAISNSGCSLTIPGTDSIRVESVSAAFEHTINPFCGYAVLNLQDSSTANFGIQSVAWLVNNNASNNTAYTQQISQQGNVSVQLIATGQYGCRDTVQALLPVSFYQVPVAAIIAPDSVCAGQPVTMSAMVQSSDSLMPIQWLIDGQAYSGDSLSTSFQQAGIHQVQLIATTIHGCADTIIKPVYVKGIPVVDSVSSQTLCHGASSTAIQFSASDPLAQFQWTNSQPGIGLPAGGSGNIPSFTATNTGTGTLTAQIQVTASAQGCISQAITLEISVNPLPSVAQPGNEQVCSGDRVQQLVFSGLLGNVTYSWTNSLTSIGLPAAGTGNVPSFIAFNNTDSQQVAQVNIIASENGCQSGPVQYLITVNPSPSAHANDQQACAGSILTIPAFTSTVSGSTFSWTNSQPSIGLPASGSGQITPFTAQLPGNTSITAQVIVTASAAGCQGTPDTMNIMVEPTPSVNQPGNQSVCTGSVTSPVNFSGNQSGASYTWTNDNPTIGLLASGQGNIPSFTGVNFGFQAATATVSVIPDLSACSGSPVQFTFTVYPLANIIQPLNQFICNGSNSGMVHFVGTTTGTSFTWTNDNPSIGLAASGSGDIPSFTAVNNTNSTVSANITVTATANGCGGVSRTFTIYVDPTPEMVQPQNIVVCAGMRVSPESFTSNLAGTSFSWINSQASIGLDASGTGDIPAFTAVNQSGFPVTAVIQVTGFANSCASLNRVFTITVYPEPLVDSLPPLSVCNGAIADSVFFSGNVAISGYTWSNSNTSIGLAASGNGPIPSFTAINNTQSDLLAVITYAAINPGCTGRSRVFNLLVHPTPVLSATADARICRGQQVQLQATNAASYTWSPAQYLSCTQCQQPVATPTGTISYVVEGVTEFGCRGRDTVRITVVQRFNMQVSPSDTICAGGRTQLFASGAASYQWSPSEGLSQANVANPFASPARTTRYRVVGFDADGCFTDTGYVNVVVGPIPVVNAGADVTATAGSSVTLQATAQNGPITQWSWTPPSGLSCDDCPSPVLTVAQSMEYVVTVTNVFGCTDNDTVRINSFCKSSQVFVPNAFTPDGDGLNDILMVRGKGIQVKSFRIFNRWGNLVFEKLNIQPNDPSQGWDGRVRGVPATPDVFVYTLEVICDSGVIQTLKGNTTILK